jgi:O-antigen/teichoic acid export membrane protein
MKVTRGLWRLSRETRGLARDAATLFFGKVATTLGFIAQIALITHVLGLREYGVYALVVAVVALVSQFFDVNVARAAQVFGSRYVASDLRKTGGVFQLSYLIDAGLGIVGFAVVVPIAFLVGPHLAEDGTLLVLLYGLTLLASTVDASSTSLLQVVRQYPTITGLIVVREIARVSLVSIALFGFGSLVAVMVFLVVQDTLTGALGVFLAMRAFRRRSGATLLEPALSRVHDIRRPFLSMIFHSNLITYGRLTQVQVPPLVLGAFAGPLEVGVFKIGLAAAAGVGQIYVPAWNAVLPRLSRLLSARRVGAVRRLLAQSSAVAFALMVSAGALAILLREPLLRLLGGGEATAAATVFVLCILAQLVNGTVFWNDSLLYAAGRAGLVSKIYLPSVALMLGLVLVLGHVWGANGVAVAVLVTSCVTNLGYTVAALRVLARE